MDEKLRWLSVQYRGMYVHVFAFDLTHCECDTTGIGKWSYLLGLQKTEGSGDIEFIHGPTTDLNDYFTKEAAQQAALHFGRMAIDTLIELG